jgi:hypothetical protein
MDAFKSDSYSQESSGGKHDRGPESVTGMFSAQPRTQSESPSLPEIEVSFHGEPPTKASAGGQLLVPPDLQPGEFTQFFQPLAVTSAPAAEGQNTGRAATPATPVKTPLPGRRLVASDERSPAATDISRVFTQLAKPQQRQPAASPGEFMQMMESFRSEPASRAQVASPIPPNQQPFLAQPKYGSSEISSIAQATNAEVSGSDSFTNFFRAISKPVTEVKTSSSDQQRGDPAPTLLNAPQAPEDVNRAASRDASTRIFASASIPPFPQAPLSLSRASEPKYNPHGEAELPFPSVPPSVRDSQSRPGGFTKLFEALSEDPAADGGLPFSAQPLPSSKAPGQQPPMQAGPGGFTRLMSALGQNQQPIEGTFPEPTRAPSVVPAPQGPSEFTRIISSSALGQKQEPGSQIDSQASRQASLSSAGAPAAPGLPLQAPSAAQFATPVMHGLVPPPLKPAPQPQAAAAHVSPSLPTPSSAVPNLAPPKVPPAPTTKLQEWLPILLVVNAFLLLLVVVLVVFLLRRH